MKGLRQNVNEIYLHLKISPEKYLAYYQGIAKDVVTTSIDGRTIQFPARILRPFLTHDGICGKFILYYDDKGKFVSIKKI